MVGSVIRLGNSGLLASTVNFLNRHGDLSQIRGPVPQSAPKI
jgi:hypothetical protein